MSVHFHKTGVISASGQETEGFVLVNETGAILTDQSGNILSSEVNDDYGLTHGFVELGDIMSVYEGQVVAHEFIEW